MCKFTRDVKCHNTGACKFTQDVKCHDTCHLQGCSYTATCGLGLVAMYVQRNLQESLHKPHDDTVAQIINRTILIVLIKRLTHVRILLSAILSVK